MPPETASRRRFLAAVGTSALATAAGCTALAGGDDFDVGMTASAFNPFEFRVSVGEEVVWNNTSTRGHTVTAYEDTLPAGADYFASGGFESEEAARTAWRDDLGGRIDSGESFRHRFDVPGRYDYVCIPHEQGGMVGAVIVEE